MSTPPSPPSIAQHFTSWLTRSISGPDVASLPPSTPASSTRAPVSTSDASPIDSVIALDQSATEIYRAHLQAHDFLDDDVEEILHLINDRDNADAPGEEEAVSGKYEQRKSGSWFQRRAVMPGDALTHSDLASMDGFLTICRREEIREARAMMARELLVESFQDVPVRLLGGRVPDLVLDGSFTFSTGDMPVRDGDGDEDCSNDSRTGSIHDEARLPDSSDHQVLPAMARQEAGKPMQLPMKTSSGYSDYLLFMCEKEDIRQGRMEDEEQRALEAVAGSKGKKPRPAHEDDNGWTFFERWSVEASRRRRSEDIVEEEVDADDDDENGWRDRQEWGGEDLESSPWARREKRRTGEDNAVLDQLDQMFAPTLPRYTR